MLDKGKDIEGIVTGEVVIHCKKPSPFYIRAWNIFMMLMACISVLACLLGMIHGMLSGIAYDDYLKAALSAVIGSAILSIIFAHFPTITKNLENN